MDRYKERIRTGVGFMYNFEENCCTWETALDEYCDHDKVSGVYYGENRSQCTWLKDDGWKYLYEWDLVKVESWKIYEVKYWKYDATVEEYWCIIHGRYIEDEWQWDYSSFSQWYFDIIWNVRENKDLLNNKQDERD